MAFWLPLPMHVIALAFHCLSLASHGQREPFEEYHCCQEGAHLEHTQSLEVLASLLLISNPEAAWNVIAAGVTTHAGQCTTSRSGISTFSGKQKYNEAPKRPPVSFARYVNERRPALLAVGVELRDVMRQAGAEWTTLTEAQKKPYADAYKADMEKYTEAMAAYEAMAPTDPIAPVRPANSWPRYVNERRPALLAVGVDRRDVMRQAGAEWKTLTEAQKKPYADAYKADMEKYTEAMAAYKVEFLEKQTDARKLLEKPILVNKPSLVKPYQQFLASKLQVVKASNPGIEGRGIMKIVGEMWREAPESEKASFLKQYEIDKAEYAKKLADYMKSDEYLAYEKAMKRLGEDD